MLLPAQIRMSVFPAFGTRGISVSCKTVLFSRAVASGGELLKRFSNPQQKSCVGLTLKLPGFAAAILSLLKQCPVPHFVAFTGQPVTHKSPNVVHGTNTICPLRPIADI
jgi:hypothetical protein